MTLDIADRLEIHELLGLYGHLIDEKRWEDLDQVFTEDLVYDATDFGSETTHSLAELQKNWSSDQWRHPLAHHATNIVIWVDDDGTVRAQSKGIGVGRKGRVGSAVYHDVLVKTIAGWRMASRRALLRRAGA